MRLNPQELSGMDDSSIGALIRTGLLQDGVDIVELGEALSKEEVAEILGTQSLEDNTSGLDYLQCSSCESLVMFARGTVPPSKCSKCGEEIENPLDAHKSTTPATTIIFHINGGEVTTSQSQEGVSSGTDQNSEGVEALRFGETLTLKDVPIFAVGTHNGKEYTEKDLDQMVLNAVSLKGKVVPPLKLGHKGQKIIKTQGMPAAGWMEELKRDGKLLVATFKQVPIRIAKLIKDGAWKRPSAEIYKNFKDAAGKEWGYVVAAVALLGADPPAIKELPAWDSLPEIEKLYNSSLDGNEIEIVELQFEDGELVIVNNDTQEGRSDESMSGGAPNTDITTRMQTLEELVKQQKIDHEAEMTEMGKKVEAAQALSRKSSMEAFLEKAKKEGKLTPAVEEKVLAFAEILETVDVYKYSETADDGTVTELEKPALDLFKEIIEGLPVVVDYDERSKGDGSRNGKGVEVTVGAETFEAKKGKNEVVTEAETHEEVLKYCKDKGWDPEDAEMYAEAYIATSKDDPTIE